MDMEEMMKSLMGGMKGDPSMAADAQRLWKMLDDLAESDPQAYGKFLSSQMEGAKEAAPKAPTKPAFCIECKLKKPTSRVPIFINVTHCGEVAEAYKDESSGKDKVTVPGPDEEDEDAKDDGDLTGMRIPIARTKETPSSDPSVSSVYEVAVNTLVVLRAAKDPAFKRMLEMTVMAAAAQFFKLDLSPNYSISTDKFKGDKTEPVLLSLAKKSGPGGGGGSKQQGGGQGDGGGKKPLIQEVERNAKAGGSKVTKGGGMTSERGSGGGGGEGGRGGSGSAQASVATRLGSPEGLIESLRQRNQAPSSSVDKDADDVHLNLPVSGTAPRVGLGGGSGGAKVLIEEVVTEPDYQLVEEEERLVLTVQMPLSEGVGEMDLIVSERCVSVKSYHYTLEVGLQASVDSDGVAAKFNKKKKCLVLKLPLLK